MATIAAAPVAMFFVGVEIAAATLAVGILGFTISYIVFKALLKNNDFTNSEKL